MKTNQPVRTHHCRARFLHLAFALGVLWLAASWAGGDLTSGLMALAWITFLAIAILVGARKSETLAGLIDGNDERLASIDLRATAIAGAVNHLRHHWSRAVSNSGWRNRAHRCCARRCGGRDVRSRSYLASHTLVAGFPRE